MISKEECYEQKCVDLDRVNQALVNVGWTQ